MKESKTEIIELKVRPRYPLSVKLNKEPFTCKHLSVEIDKVERVASCQICNQKIDPLEYLIRIGYEEQQQEWRLEQLKYDITQLSKARDELERKVTNLKSQVRRLEKENKNTPDLLTPSK